MNLSPRFSASLNLAGRQGALALGASLNESLQLDLARFFVGPKGDEGDPGPLGNDAHLVHDQQTAAETWEITHNLGKYPAVTVIDSAGDQVEGDLQYLGLNTVRITFGAAFAGRAFFN